MLILSNGLCETADEGFLNVANSLVKRIKKADATATVISYERKSSLTDRFLTLNKLLLSRELFTLLRKNKSSFLYIPFPAKMLSTALRIFILSLFSKSRVNALLVMKGDIDFFSKLFFKLSRAKIIVLSKESEDFYKSFLPFERVAYIKAGVDTDKFIPVNKQKSSELKQKYGFDPDRPVILHVGHLSSGRNIAELMNLSSEYQVLLVTSTLTKNEQDKELRSRLLSHSNIRIIDDYIPDIQEIYQLSDVYFFPVVKEGHCIDLPLSCLEAAACDLPVVTTAYGAMKEFKAAQGFHFIKSFKPAELNALIQKALKNDNVNTRGSALCYDWDGAVDFLLKL